MRGGETNSRVLSDEEYVDELKKKLLEEVKELFRAKPQKLVEEIADVQEIVDNMLEALKTSKEEIKEKQDSKNNERGSFRKRIYIDTIEIPEDDEWLDYYLANPDKYPEIKNF